MNSTRTSILMILMAPVVHLCQSPSVAVPNVDEPPELSGPAKKYTPPSGVFLEFAKFMETAPVDSTDPDKLKFVRVGLTTFINQHPDFSNAYTMRAWGDFCFQRSRDYDAIGADLERAFKTLSPNKVLNMFQPAALFAMHGKVRFDSGRYKEALDDLEAAMNANLDGVDEVIGSVGSNAESKADPCVWTAANLDLFSQKFPKDYRVQLLLGLSLQSSAAFNLPTYQSAVREFQKAALLNPLSALPHYFIGVAYAKAALLSETARTSDEARNEPKNEGHCSFQQCRSA